MYGVLALREYVTNAFKTSNEWVLLMVTSVPSCGLMGLRVFLPVAIAQGNVSKRFFDNITSHQELIYRKPMKAPLILNE